MNTSHEFYYMVISQSWKYLGPQIWKGPKKNKILHMVMLKLPPYIKRWLNLKLFIIWYCLAVQEVLSSPEVEGVKMGF